MGIYHLMNILALRTKVGPKAFKCLFLYFISMNVRPLVDLKKLGSLYLSLDGFNALYLGKYKRYSFKQLVWI